jgi:hypothetical protein
MSVPYKRQVNCSRQVKLQLLKFYDTDISNFVGRMDVRTNTPLLRENGMFGWVFNKK